MMKIKCNKCGYEWNYKGRRTRYATCPNCKASVKIPQQASGGDECPRS